MTEIFDILAIVSASLSILVGFLLIFIQSFSNRIRALLQSLELKKIGWINQSNKSKRINKCIKNLKENKTISRVEKMNLLVFFYIVVIFVISMIFLLFVHLEYYISKELICGLIIFTIIGYLLLIPLAIYSYYITYKIKLEI